MTVGCEAAVIPVEVGIAIIEGAAVKCVRTPAIDQATVVPIKSPAMPAPAESEEGTYWESDSERKVWASDAPPRVEARPYSNRITVNILRIVFRHVDDFWVRGLNDDLWTLVGYSLLRSRLQMTGFFRFFAHFLNGLHQVGLLVVIRVAQFGSPGEIFV